MDGRHGRYVRCTEVLDAGDAGAQKIIAATATVVGDTYFKLPLDLHLSATAEIRLKFT